MLLDEKSYPLVIAILEVLVIGKGAASEKINQREIINMCWKYNLGVEVLSTPLAVGTFNFLNFEGRYVAAALIPPNRIDVYDDRRQLKQLETARDIRLSIEEKPKIKRLPTPEAPAFLKRLVHPSDKDKQGHQRCVFFSTAAETPTASQKELDDERLILPSLKKLVNHSKVAMQMPDMTRKYAVSDAPLIPSYFLGKLQLELLEYPELPTKEEVIQINNLFTTVEDWVTKVDSKSIDEKGAIPEEVLRDCKIMGLFGQRVNPCYGGLDMTPLESVLVAEAMGYDPSLFATVTVHEALGLKGLQLVGTEAQKEKYLPALASGEKIAAFCLTEVSSGATSTQSQARAILSPDSRHYILNGRKAWVVNGSRADVFTVFALTSIPNEKGENEDRLSAFLVERGFEGTIEAQPPLERIGLRGLDLVDVTFKDVRVPVENVLGALGSGTELSGRIACSERYLVGGLCVGLCRNVLDALTEHCSMRHQFGRPLSHFGVVQRRLAHAAAQLYAMESVTYLVAGFLTSRPQRDLAIESSAVKLFATETTLTLLNDCVALAGALGFTKQLPLERYLRDSRVLTSFMGVNDLLRIYIASTSLSKVGKELRHFVECARSPSQHMWYMLREAWRKDWRTAMLTRRWGMSPAIVTAATMETERGIRASMRVGDHLHPNLQALGDRLARLVVQAYELTRQVFILHANTVNEDQFSLWLLSDLAVGLFTATAVLSRASRAKSIGVRYHNNELELAELFTLETLDRLQGELSSFKQKANLRKRIASVMVKESGYASASPLSRVW
ncbi:Acyl-CoA dehydrogenase family member 9 [Echinococcus granulosus]|uniref:Acyl-CoA dehydrogenase family member 9 n=1 Tax=Echinococcus granulosus TaxID=6210 RepID=W6UCY7_ECHGR|nr:Acyl-CoA dehydrogenase family member 9 [Echinococcus granulosus]EUB56162.1 Acyl-CoA dehydrogenase family member 9 [Echinococcus granulosus]